MWISTRNERVKLRCRSVNEEGGSFGKYQNWPESIGHGGSGLPLSGHDSSFGTGGRQENAGCVLCPACLSATRPRATRPRAKRSPIMQINHPQSVESTAQRPKPLKL